MSPLPDLNHVLSQDCFVHSGPSISNWVKLLIPGVSGEHCGLIRIRKFFSELVKKKLDMAVGSVRIESHCFQVKASWWVSMTPAWSTKFQSSQGRLTIPADQLLLTGMVIKSLLWLYSSRSTWNHSWLIQYMYKYCWLFNLRTSVLDQVKSTDSSPRKLWFNYFHPHSSLYQPSATEFLKIEHTLLDSLDIRHAGSCNTH